MRKSYYFRVVIEFSLMMRESSRCVCVSVCFFFFERE